MSKTNYLLSAPSLEKKGGLKMSVVRQAGVYVFWGFLLSELTITLSIPERDSVENGIDAVATDEQSPSFKLRTTG